MRLFFSGAAINHYMLKEPKCYHMITFHCVHINDNTSVPMHINIPTTPLQIQPNSVCNRAYTSLIRVSNFDDAHRFDSCHAASSPTIVIRCFLAAGPHLSLLDSEVLLKLQIAKQVSTQSRAADHSTHILPYIVDSTQTCSNAFRVAVSQVPITLPMSKGDTSNRHVSRRPDTSRTSSIVYSLADTSEHKA